MKKLSLTRPVSTRVTRAQYAQLVSRAAAKGVKLGELIYERLEPLFTTPLPRPGEDKET